MKQLQDLIHVAKGVTCVVSILLLRGALRCNRDACMEVPHPVQHSPHTFSDRGPSLKKCLETCWKVTGGSQGCSDTQKTRADTQKTSPDTQLTISDSQLTIPDTQLTIPETQLTILDTHLIFPDTHLTIPDTQLANPDTQMTNPGTRPQQLRKNSKTYYAFSIGVPMGEGGSLAAEKTYAIL